MRDFLKKLGSLTVGLSALALVLAHAAMTHGCASSSNMQASPPPAAVAESGSPAANAATAAAAGDPCEPPEYMYATKAPIWIPPGCPGGGPLPAKAQPPSSPANAQQQAP